MRTVSNKWAAAVLFTSVLGASSASAIVRRHDVPDSQYIVPASDYPAVVDLYPAMPGDCLATLIAPEWLVTAAHCVDTLAVSNTLQIGAATYGIAQIVTHVGWNDDTDDITLIRVDAAVPDVDPIPWYTDSDEIGQVVWFVGRGDTSTGDVGGGTADGNTRAATNTVIGADRFWLRFVFNAPGDAEVTDLEGISGDGDSGGPALIETAQGLRVAGLSSFQENGNQTLGTYGVEEFYTRVSQYTDWIEDLVGTIPMPKTDAGMVSMPDAGPTPDAGPAPIVDAGSIEPPDAGPDAGSGTRPAPKDTGSPPNDDAVGCGCTAADAPTPIGGRFGFIMVAFVVGLFGRSSEKYIGSLGGANDARLGRAVSGGWRSWTRRLGRRLSRL